MNGSWLADQLARLEVRYPEVHLVFADSRCVAEEWTYRFLATAHADAPTGVLLHGVLGEGRKHELGSALFAIAGALFFGLGFGRVLQLVHARAWQLPQPKPQRPGD